MIISIYYFSYIITIFKVVSDFDIFFTESAQLTECHNHTAVEFIEQNKTQYQIIIIISALMNGLLLIVVIGELFLVICKNIIMILSSININLDYFVVILPFM